MSPPAPKAPDAIFRFNLAGQPLTLAIHTNGTHLCEIAFVNAQKMLAPRTAIAEQVVVQLDAYLDDPQRPFDLPLQMEGTEHQRRLWTALCHLSPGQTRTYGQLAKQLRSAAQAIGQACRRNPVPIVVPCHRILSQTGIGGYAGAIEGEKMRFKQALLAHEGIVSG